MLAVFVLDLPDRYRIPGDAPHKGATWPSSFEPEAASRSLHLFCVDGLVGLLAHMPIDPTAYLSPRRACGSNA